MQKKGYTKINENFYYTEKHHDKKNQKIKRKIEVFFIKFPFH